MSKESGETYSEEETARRRDEVIRRMANTPPQPKPKKASGASRGKKRGRRPGQNPDG
jgi:hypothetical protein